MKTNIKRISAEQAEEKADAIMLSLFGLSGKDKMEVLFRAVVRHIRANVGEDNQPAAAASVALELLQEFEGTE